MDVTIAGRIESFESPLFTADPSVDISIICYNPDFYDPEVVEVVGRTVSDGTEMELNYEGTTETGCMFVLHADRAITEFTIYQRLPDGTQRSADFSPVMAAGDTLEISSVVGSKSVLLNHGGVETSALYSMAPQAAWLTLEPGVNFIRVYTTGAAVPYDISYTTKYGGL